MLSFEVPLDEAQELKALKTSLSLARGFQLFFVVCNDDQKLRQWLPDQLSPSFPTLHVKILGTQTTSVAQTLEGEDAAVLLLGFDNLLTGPSEPSLHPLVTNLNKDRDAFINGYHYPLIFAVSRFALTAIAQGAPDFFSIRSGVFYFASAVENSALFQEVGSSAQDDLTFQDKSEQLKKIEHLFRELEEAPSSEKNLSNQMFLLNQKHGLLRDLGRYAEAEEAVRADLQLALTSGNKESQAISLINLVAILRDQRKRNEATVTRQQALELIQDLPEFQPAYYHGAGLDLMEEGDYAGATQYFERALFALDKQSPDHLEREPGILVNLGICHAHMGDSQKAEFIIRSAWQLAEERNLPFALAHAVGNLAVVYSGSGKFQEAYGLYATAAKSLSRHGTRDSLLAILVGWATLNERLGKEKEGRFLRNLARETIKGRFVEVSQELASFEANDFTLKEKSSSPSALTTSPR